LGSTDSIGIQALEAARNLNIEVLGISANSNIDILEKQALEFKPRLVAVADREAALQLKLRLAGTGISVLQGIEGLKAVASIDDVDTVISSIVGIAGLVPTLEAIRNGKDIALANKETLVTAGSIVMSEAKKHNVRILPVDSEHSAIFQCLAGNEKQDVERIILTASGGPFRGMKLHELKKVTVAQALKHPNWKMGNKITIDSATLMNKGLEVIEASWLFGMPAKKIKVLIHPQSIIHSMVEYVDGSVMAQLGSPDMRIPIQLALTFPRRYPNNFSRLDLLISNRLTFEEPDTGTFRCLELAYIALKEGGTMPAAMNAANEVAVSLFLDNKIRFTQIPDIIEHVMERHTVCKNPCLEDILETDARSRELVKEITDKVKV